jgi:hypothetical protein
VLVFPLLFVPWLVMYEWVVYRGPAAGALRSYLPGEVHWPIWQWMEIPYFSAYVLVTLAPLCAPTNRVLRRFVIAGGIATVFVFLVFLTVPLIAPPRFHSALHGILSDQMMLGNGRGPLWHCGVPVGPSCGAFLGAVCSLAAATPPIHIWCWATLVAAIACSGRTR